MRGGGEEPNLQEVLQPQNSRERKLFQTELAVIYIAQTMSNGKIWKTRQSKHCGFSIYIFDNSKSKSMVTVRLVRAEKMVLSDLVFARKIARKILIQNI